MGINYVPGEWEDGITVINASHFEKIEKGITDIIDYNNSIYTDVVLILNQLYSIYFNRVNGNTEEIMVVKG